MKYSQNSAYEMLILADSNLDKIYSQDEKFKNRRNIASSTLFGGGTALWSRHQNLKESIEVWNDQTNKCLNKALSLILNHIEIEK